MKDPLSSGWNERAGRKGLQTAKRIGRGGRVTWLVWSANARVQVHQLPETVDEVTILDPTVGQMQLVSELRYTGLVLPR